MEAVGVVLGALPLAIEAVKNYQECSQTLKSYWKYNDTLQNIKDRLFLQQRILNTTWEEFTDTKHPTLEQIQQKLRRLEPQDYDGFMSVIKHMNSMFDEVLEKLDIDAEGKVIILCGCSCTRSSANEAYSLGGALTHQIERDGNGKE